MTEARSTRDAVPRLWARHVGCVAPPPMTMMTPAQADEIIQRSMRTLPAVSCPLQAARGRILDRDLSTDRDAPPFDRVAMDGIAIRHAAWAAGTRAFARRGIHRAGAPAPGLGDDDRDGCFEVMTGAMLPRGCDCVVRIEDVRWDGEVAHVTETLALRPWKHVHRQGSDARAGAMTVRRGTRLLAAEIAIAAAAGHASVPVAAPRIAIVSTGDELVDVGARPEPHQIRGSNAHAIDAALRGDGFPDLASFTFPDDRPVLRRGLEDLLASFDVIVLSGGISAGRFDLVPGVLAELGVAPRVYKVRQRPGKPMWFGTSASGQPVFGLPGNPVAALVCCYRYVLPALRRAAGRIDVVDGLAVDAPLARDPSLTLFVPVRRSSGGVVPVFPNGSGDLGALAGTDGVVELAPGDSPTAPGERLPFRSWS